MIVEPSERGAAAPQPINASLISKAFAIGAVLGHIELAALLAGLRSVPPLNVLLLWLYAGLSNGLASAAVAWAAWVWVRVRHRQPPEPAPLAIGVAVGTVLSVYAVLVLARLRQPQLAWLLPACILSGAAGGPAAWWISRRSTALQASTTWCGLDAAALGVGLTAVALRHADNTMRWYTAAVAATAAVGLGVAALAGSPSGRRRAVVVCNIILSTAMLAMPLAVGGLDRLHPVVPRSAATPPNILLISVDTLRSDRLGCYGYASARTPNIDALAKDGVLFEQATSPLSVTGPSHTTMLTGLYPVHHGATANGIPLRNDAVTVADVLARRGYRSAAFVSGWPLKDAAAGLAARFDYYDDDFTLHPVLPDVVLRLHVPQLIAGTAQFLTGRWVDPLERRGPSTTDRILAWLAGHRDRPVFLLAHYYDPHAPYTPPPPYDTMHDPDYRGTLHEFRLMQPLAEWRRLLSNPRDIEHVKMLYAGEISYADTAIGRLLDGVARLGLADNTVVILTSDHGESLTEHNFYFDHAEYLYETDIHVPLLMRFPARRHAGMRWPGQVGLVDLAPTVLELAGVDRVPIRFDGRTLLPILNGAEPAGERVSYGAIHLGQGEDVRARYYVRHQGYKLIWNFDRRELLSEAPASEELYDLKADAGETSNLMPPPSLFDELRARMAVWIREKPQPVSKASASVAERLHALGY